ncbi:MAG: peptide chain release factor 2 [Patescibacteria group bacterium]
MKEANQNILDLKNRLEKLRVFLEIAKKEKEIKQIESEIAKAEFWRDKEISEKKIQRFNQLKEELNRWENLNKMIAELSGQRNQELIAKAEKEINNLERLTYFSGPCDKNNALLSLHAGAGGTDAQDWAEMLLRMYVRFCEKKGWLAQVIDESRGGEAGIKSATIEIEGQYAYGFLKGEAGVHRLVRISPFDAEKMRHTSFALVQVLPELEEVEIEINPEDLKIETFRASAKGGQKVQKAETAVRITHLPTKITVSCQVERSQYQNKERALKILKSKLYQYYQDKREEEKAILRGELKSISWGNQIRSYVLHPYKMVKDHRTGYETSDVQKILDGDLDELIEERIGSGDSPLKSSCASTNL